MPRNDATEETTNRIVTEGHNMRAVHLRFQDRDRQRLQEVMATADVLVVPRVGEKVHLVNQRYTVTEVLHDYYEGYFRGIDVTLEEL